MAKEINPKNQTKKISQAQYELLKRDPARKKEYEARHHIDSMRKWSPVFFEISEKEFEEILKSNMCPPAASEVDLDEILHLEILPKITKEKDPEIERLKLSWLKYIFDDAEKNTPSPGRSKSILVKIDLSRSKEVIKSELEAVVSEAQKRHRGKKSLTRLKWLSIVDELLVVWDLYEKFGQGLCFHQIAQKLAIPISTVRSRWEKAYSLIFHCEYDSKKVREQGNDAALELCAGCQDQSKCYKTKNGIMNFSPCSAYLKLARPEYSRERMYENFNEILEKSSYSNSYLD